MHLKIRDIDPVAIKKLDEEAKRKGISRQKLLKGLIEMSAFMPEHTKREKELENLLDKNILAMSQCYKAMEKMNQFVEQMTMDDSIE